MEWYEKLFEWAIEIVQTDQFWIAIISALVSAVVAAFVGIAFSKIEKDELTINKLSLSSYECDKMSNDKVYNQSVYFVNKDDRAVRNVYLKYTFKNSRKKKRFKAVKPDQHYIIEEYASHKDISNTLFYKSYIPYLLSLVIFDFPDFIRRKIGDLFRIIVWKKIKPIIVNFRILLLFLKINSIYNDSKKFDEEIVLFLFVHKTSYEKRLAEYLNFTIYRKWSNERTKLLLNKFFNKEDRLIGSSNEYRAYASFIMEFFIYYFAVHKDMKVEFFNEITHIPGVVHIGNEQVFERFTIDYKTYKPSSPIELIKLFRTYKRGQIAIDSPDFRNLERLWKKDRYKVSESLGNIVKYEPRVSESKKFEKQVGIELYSNVRTSYPLFHSIEIRGLKGVEWQRFANQKNIWFYGDKTIINRIILLNKIIPETPINELPSIISDTDETQQVFIVNVCNGNFIYFGHETFSTMKYFRYGQIKPEILEEIIDGLEILSDYKKFKRKYKL